MTPRSRSIGFIPFALVVALGACTHTPVATPPASSPIEEDAAVSDSAATRPPGLYTQEEFPDMTPEKMARRFLRFIGSLERYEQLTLEHLEQVMALKLEGPAGGRARQFNIHMPDSDWYYAVVYSRGLTPPRQAFARMKVGHGQDDDRADMTPVCGLDFAAQVKALVELGFEAREDLAVYDAVRAVPFMDERGDTANGALRGRRLTGYDYSRGDVRVSIRSRFEALESEEKRRHDCVLEISVGRLQSADDA